MNDPLYRKLRESGWRRKLTASEEAELSAWLAMHPEMQADWETEAELNEALSGLPDAPVASNFTARVLQAIEQDAAAARGTESPLRWTWRSLLPKAAVVLIVLGLGLLSYGRYQTFQRVKLARSVAVVSGVAAVPDSESLRDFQAIRSLGRTPSADEELLALLK